MVRPKTALAQYIEEGEKGPSTPRTPAPVTYSKGWIEQWNRNYCNNACFFPEIKTPEFDEYDTIADRLKMIQNFEKRVDAAFQEKQDNIELQKKRDHAEKQRRIDAEKARQEEAQRKKDKVSDYTSSFRNY